MAAKPILETCPCIWYLTPSDNSIILCASDNYYEREHGTWDEHPPMPIEGGLLVHWMTRVKGDCGSRDRFWELRATGDDEKFVELCESWGWDVAGPSYEGSFLVLDTIGKAWIFTAVDAGPWGRNVVEALWTPFNVAYMNRQAYPLPYEEVEDERL